MTPTESKRRGAPQKLTDEQAMAALNEIAKGNATPRAACALLGVHYSTLRRAAERLGCRVVYRDERYRVVRLDELLALTNSHETIPGGSRDSAEGA